MPLIAIDIETDGLEPAGGSILEIAAFELDENLNFTGNSFHCVLPYTLGQLPPYPENRKIVEVIKGEASKSEKHLPPSVNKAGLVLQEGSEREKLFKLWSRMMRRCYFPTDHMFRSHGGRGATVHDAWHSFEIFEVEVKQLPNWGYKRENWEDWVLDKDYFGAMQYGKETSIWLHRTENCLYTSKTKGYTLVEFDNEPKRFLTAQAVADYLGVNIETVRNILKKGFPPTKPEYLGMRLIQRGDNTLYRLEIPALKEVSSFVVDMHTNNGLWEECANATGSLKDFTAWMEQFDNPTLFGSSVHFDKAWIEHHCPELKLNYRIVDVSSLVGLIDIRPDELKAHGKAAHRAVDDILRSIEIGKFYLNLLKQGY